MKRGLMHAFGFVAAAALALGAGPASADSVGPYYATPSWDQTLPSSTRFIVLANFGSAAVLDRETGLVWEQSPDNTEKTWAAARFACILKTVGSRKGWRLPTVQELASLIDPAVAFPGPTLPAGNPFSHVRSGGYWSASTLADSTDQVWVAGFDFGFLTPVTKSAAGNIFTWCVRGGQGTDAQ